MITQKLLEDTLSIAKQAGAELMRLYKTGLPPETKKDGSVVTAADRASEGIILPALRKLWPDMPIVSEEAVEAGDIPDISGQNFWCVDPLDGTRHFVEQTGRFAVLIGLVQNGQPTLGVIHMPVLQKSWYGAMGVGVWRDSENGAVRFNPADKKPTTRTLVDIYEKSRDAEARAIAREYADVDFAPTHDPYRYLSTVFDDYERVLYFGPSYEWDTAAPHGILRGFGHDLRRIDGTILDYGKKPIFKNPDLMCGKF